MLSGPKLADRKGRGITEPLEGRSKMHHKRVEEDLERIKENPDALTEYCTKQRKELGSKYTFEAMQNAMDGHVLSLGTSLVGVKRKSTAGETTTSVKLKLTNGNAEKQVDDVASSRSSLNHY